MLVAAIYRRPQIEPDFKILKSKYEIKRKIIRGIIDKVSPNFLCPVLWTKVSNNLPTIY